MSKKEQTTNKSRGISVYTKIIKALKQAQKQQKAGDQEAVNKILSELVDTIKDSIEEVDKFENAGKVREFDRSILPSNGEVFAANSDIELKVISQEEKDYYMKVSKECSETPVVFENQLYIDTLWDEFLSEKDFICSIYDAKSKNFIGYCTIKNLYVDVWELGIEELKEYRHKGFGYKAIRLFIDSLTAISDVRFFKAKIDIDNCASQNLVKKLGFYPDGLIEYVLHNEELKEYQKEQSNYIDEHIIKLADEFCVEPEDLLGHVLQYRLDTQNN